MMSRTVIANCITGQAATGRCAAQVHSPVCKAPTCKDRCLSATGHDSYHRVASLQLKNGRNVGGPETSQRILLLIYTPLPVVEM